MLLVIIVVSIVCILVGLPVLVVSVTGGLAMSLLAYYLTRNERILRLGFCLFTIAGMRYFIIHSGTQEMAQAQLPLPEWVYSFLTSATLLVIASVIVMLLSAFYGIFGPGRD